MKSAPTTTHLAPRACRLAQITYQRDKEIILGARAEILDRAFAELPLIEQRALELYREDPQKAIEFLNDYSSDFARATVDRMWEVGDTILLRYVSGF